MSAGARSHDWLLRVGMYTLPNQPPSEPEAGCHGNDLRCYAWSDAVVAAAQDSPAGALEIRAKCATRGKHGG